MPLNIINNTADLGRLLRAERKSSKVTLQQTSDQCNIGIRFLSELERGKETAEIGKVISALHAVGLDLAVIQKSNNYQSHSSTSNSINESTPAYLTKSSQRLSEQLNLEFPYDWSNPNLDNSTFIRLVLVKTRFNDILSIAHHFGIELIEDEAKHLIDTPQFNVIKKLLSHIRTGITISKSNT